MIEQLQLYRTDGTNPHRNLAVEQYLLETVPEHTCTLYLWQNRRTVVIGRNQNAWKECRTTQLEADGGFLARRLSGGGAVFHDLGNLNFTFLVRKADYDLDRQLSVIAEAGRALGIRVERSGRNDLLADGKKFSGNAFYEHNGRSYHHGTIMVNVDGASLSRYLSPSKAKLEAKGVASVRSRVVNLKELRPDLTIAEMAAQMEAAFAKVYGLPPVRLREEDFDGAYIDALTEKNGSWEWLYGRDMKCTLQCRDRYSWGEIELRLGTGEGLVREAAVYTDSMDWALAPALERALTGCRLRLEDLESRVRAAGLEAQTAEDICALLKQQDI